MDYVFVYGYVVVDELFVSKKCINVDIGVYFSGVLLVVCLMVEKEDK